MTEISNLASAVISVMKTVRGMEKNSQVGSGRSSYSGVKDQDVKEVFNEALADNGLAVLPIGIEEETKISSWMVDGQYGQQRKQSVFTSVKTRYLLIHDSGESLEIAGYGHGIDPQDKAAGKATTYALKNALLYSFLTPVGKIDDTDTTHSSDIETPDPPPAPITDGTIAELLSASELHTEFPNKDVFRDWIKNLFKKDIGALSEQTGKRVLTFLKTEGKFHWEQVHLNALTQAIKPKESE